MAETRAAIYHLKRLDVYETEKPYIFAYDIPPGTGPTTNHAYEPFDKIISDAQHSFQEFSVDVHGFAFAEWKTDFTSADFDNASLVQDKYLPQVLKSVGQISPPGSQLHILNHVRRKRGPNFPNVRETTEAGVLNPVIFAHADYTEHGARVALRRILEDQPEVKDHSFDIINVWRPTKGPNTHWPLALCDFQTVDKGDVETSDVIYKDSVGESVRLYASPKHRWYYLDNQTTDQVIIFRSAALGGLDVPFGPHSSFARSKGDNVATAIRESIEVRVARFFPPESETVSEEAMSS